MNIQQQSVSHSNFLFGVPFLGSGREESIGDRRKDPRVSCNGKIRLVPQSGATPFLGNLINISANGFRVSFAHTAPVAGAEVEFRHRFFRGRAQLIWTLWKENHYEGGFSVLRD